MAPRLPSILADGRAGRALRPVSPGDALDFSSRRDPVVEPSVSNGAETPVASGPLAHVQGGLGGYRAEGATPASLYLHGPLSGTRVVSSTRA